MKNTLTVLAVITVSALAYAGAPAKTTAPAKPAAAAAPAGVITEADCDMHKAEGAMMKDVMASGAKMEVVKLDHGMTSIITADAKSAPAVEKAMAGMDAAVKNAAEGKAKVCEPCQQKMGAIKAGKVVDGMGHAGMTWTHSALSSDPEIVKMMHAEIDAHQAAMAKK